MKSKEIVVDVINKNDKDLPVYAKDGDSGVDLYSTERVYLRPSSFKLIKTGISVAIPEGYEIQIRSRSGLAYKNGIFVLNSPGTIDSGFRNEIGVILCNINVDGLQIEIGDKIAQAVLCPVCKIKWNEVETLDKTERNLDGFGSTGV